MAVILRMIKLACIASASTSSLALAQSFVPPQPLTAPVEQSVDVNGVDLVTGKVRAPFAAMSIGTPGDGGILLRQSINLPNNLEGSITSSGSIYTVTLGGDATKFTLSGSTYIPNVADGSSLSLSNGLYIFSSNSGAKANFSTSYGTLYYASSTGGTNQQP